MNGWRVWVDAWRAHFGQSRPDPSPVGKNIKAAKQIAGVVGDDTGLADVFQRYLEDGDPFLVKQGHALSLLPARLDAYRGNGKGSPAEKRPVREFR